MDCYEILTLSTQFNEDTNNVINDEKLKELLDTVNSKLPEGIFNELTQDRSQINEADDTGWKYLHMLLYTIKTLCKTELAQENPLFTVSQFKIMKTTIEIVASVGIIPFLLPQIKTHATTIRTKTFKLSADDSSIFEKYKRISYTTKTLLECYDQVILRPALISQLDCILAALLQLSHAPLKKPTEQSSTIPANVCNSVFEMTTEIYVQLKEEQDHFCKMLQDLIENSPQSLLIKEFMKLLGLKNNPKWLQINTKHYLTKRIMSENGVVSLTLAICDDISDMGKCWDKLDVTARLVATSHGSDAEKYYDSISHQILELFSAKDNKQGNIIANCCIKALYDYNPDVCLKKVIHVIMRPFLIKYDVSNQHLNVIKTEEEVSQSIENLSKLFLTTDAEFKCLPTSLLTSIVLPIFYLHLKTFNSVYIFKNQVRQLLLKILEDESTRETIFSVLLNHQESKEHGEKLYFKFGVNGGCEISSEVTPIEYEEVADCLFDLVVKNGCLSFNLFTYLLKILPKLNDIAQNVEKGKLLETAADTMERIEKQIIAVKLLTLLSSSTSVQEAQIKNPEPLLDLIKFFFSKIISSSSTDQDADILYTSLMFVKIIITEGKVTQTWKTFQDFVHSVRQDFNFRKVPTHIASIVEEIEHLVNKKGRSYAQNYYDLSADNKKLNEFDKAVADLADPLLPVRAHGIISLTKLIERRHPEVTVKKDFLLCIFQENLDHNDSFIYLAAINGICAMSSMFPDKVIEILVQEFIGLTQRTRDRDVSPETRAKLGEILVKTTRSLGEMTPKYKSLLVNGFLCGTKDSDPIVRASSLSCLGEFCKIMGFRLGNLIIEILYCIGCIIKTDKDDGCRRAGVLVATLLLRGLGKDALTELGENLVTLYRSLKHLRDNDKDPVLQLHAQLALEEFDDIVQQFLFAKPKLEKSVFLLPNY